jgi:threonine aldolase
VKNIAEILNQCSNVLPGYRPRRPMKEVFAEVADALDGHEYQDTYGGGAELAEFESEVAALFGKEAAVFMPSGIMAQQIALRIWCEKRRNLKIAMHPTAHPERAEHLAYQVLHGLQRLQFGAPEFVRDRMLTTQDFQALGQEPGAVLLELPYRPLGGRLPAWEDLLATRAWAVERGIKMHLDGARIWQCRPFYQKAYHEIAALFDSVYVSFYKDIGGLCGAMLLGPAEFVAEARVWQVRHGGRLFTQGPSWISAQLRMKQVLPQIDAWVERARSVAAVLASCEGIRADPDPPHTSMFNLYVEGDHEALTRRHMELAEETGTFLFFGLGLATVPGVVMTEIHCFENTLRFDCDRLKPFVDRLLQEPGGTRGGTDP